MLWICSMKSVPMLIAYQYKEDAAGYSELIPLEFSLGLLLDVS